MELQAFPKKIQPHLLPKIGGRLEYNCLQCGENQAIDTLLYTCPACGGVLMIENRDDRALTSRSGAHWQRVFDYRRMVTEPALRGIFCFHELIAPVIPLPSILYLGEGHTPSSKPIPV